MKNLIKGYGREYRLGYTVLGDGTAMNIKVFSLVVECKQSSHL
jgi:hypothetical protein